MRRHPMVQMFTWGAVASAIGLAIVLNFDWFPVPASTASDDIDRLYDVLLIFSIPIFVLVMTVAIYSMIKFRAKPGDTGDGPPIHGNTRLEIVWVTIPFLIVAGLAAYSWIVLDDIEAKQPNEMVVQVTGQQFTWVFDYQQEGGEPVRTTELVLPKDRPVKFEIQALDVIHSFWVPEFRLKQDAVPGVDTEIRLTPNRLGEYSVVCAELCGIGHATMRQNVRVVEENEFTAWIREQGQPAQAGGGGEGGGPDPAALFADNGCGGCHTLAKAQGSGTSGPELDGLAQVAAEREPGKSAEEYTREAITDPSAFVVDGFGDTMPKDFGERLSDEEVDALVSYLLEEGEGR